MAVAEERRRERMGAQLLARAEDWVRGHGYRLMVLNARLGAEGKRIAFLHPSATAGVLVEFTELLQDGPYATSAVASSQAMKPSR